MFYDSAMAKDAKIIHRGWKVQQRKIPLEEFLHLDEKVSTRDSET